MVVIARVRSVVGDGTKRPRDSGWLWDEALLLCGRRLFDRLREGRMPVTVLAPGAPSAVIQWHDPIGEQDRAKALLKRGRVPLNSPNTIRNESVDKTVPPNQCWHLWEYQNMGTNILNKSGQCLGGRLFGSVSCAIPLQWIGIPRKWSCHLPMLNVLSTWLLNSRVVQGLGGSSVAEQENMCDWHVPGRRLQCAAHTVQPCVAR